MNRIDMFCRGTNEALSDYKIYKGLDQLTYDRSLAIYYPNPHFFHTHKSNKRLINRMQLGLKKAFDDGSLAQLWQNVFKENIAFVNLKDRRLISLENPLVRDIPFEFDAYIYRP